MRQKILSIILVFAMLLPLFPSVFAAEDDYLILTIEYYVKVKDTETKIAPTYKASMLPGSDYAVASPSVAGYKVADDGQLTVTGTLGMRTRPSKFIISLRKRPQSTPSTTSSCCWTERPIRILKRNSTQTSELPPGRRTSAPSSRRKTRNLQAMSVNRAPWTFL